MTPTDDEIARDILLLCEQRGAGKTICPSEAARSLAPEGASWRDLMPEVRRVATVLKAEGRIVITKRGNPVDDPETAGAIRLGLPQR